MLFRRADAPIPCQRPDFLPLHSDYSLCVDSKQSVSRSSPYQTALFQAPDPPTTSSPGRFELIWSSFISFFLFTFCSNSPSHLFYAHLYSTLIFTKHYHSLCLPASDNTTGTVSYRIESLKPLGSPI